MPFLRRGRLEVERRPLSHRYRKDSREAARRPRRQAVPANVAAPGQLGELIAGAVLDNLYRFVVPAVAGPDRLVPLAALADQRINAAALRTAAIRGRFQATRGADGQWRSIRNWVDEYLAARYRRFPGVIQTYQLCRSTAD